MYSNEVCDLSNLTQICLGNEAFIKRMIAVAILEVTSNIVKLEECLKADNAAEIKRIVHSVKPTIQNVAKTEVFELLRSIESGEVNEDWKNNVVAFVSKMQVLKTELTQQDT